MLHRIAEALDRPVSDFYRREAAFSELDMPPPSECALMLTAFLQIADPDARTRIVDLMRAYAGN